MNASRLSSSLNKLATSIFEAQSWKLAHWHVVFHGPLLLLPLAVARYLPGVPAHPSYSEHQHRRTKEGEPRITRQGKYARRLVFGM